MTRRARGVLAVEGVQTGDGRVLVENATTWLDPPLPLRWAPADDGGHNGAVQVGTIDSIERVDGEIRASMTIDDDNVDGAEVIRRMDAGTAPMGDRFGVSIDPDDWEIEIVSTQTDAEEQPIMLIASGGPADSIAAASRPVRARALRAIAAAAGDPDPGDDSDLLWVDSSDAIVERWTRLRIRAATLLDVGAVAEAWVELDGTADETPAAEADTDLEPVAAAAGHSCSCGGTTTAPFLFSSYADTDSSSSWTVTDLATRVDPGTLDALLAAAALTRPDLFDVPVVPPAEWFPSEPFLPFATPNTITNQGRVFGHVARWGTCHVGYGDRCVTPPRGGDYSLFTRENDEYDRLAPLLGGRPGIALDDGSFVSTGVLAWGVPHAELTDDRLAAFAHYADSRFGWADVVVGEDEFGPWYSGALRPGLTVADVRVLRGLSISGDWRENRRTNGLDLVAALAVNFPGFPVTAAAGRAVSTESVPRARFDGDRVVALVAAGSLPPDRQPEHGAVNSGALERRLATLERGLSRRARERLNADRADEARGRLSR